jgi:hypothetical protein
MGRYDRLFIIDGDHIHIVAVDQKMLDMSSKTISYHIENVISCKSKKGGAFKIVVVKGSGELKGYEMEAGSVGEAGDICGRVMLIKNK